MTPAGWTTVKLRDVSRGISYGFTASASDAPDGPRMLRITDIQNNHVDWRTVPRCKCDAPAKYLLCAGDLVIARTGATTGKSFLLRDVPEPSVFASYLIRVQPAATVTPEYLASYLQSPAYWAQITIVSKGTAQPGANASILGDLELPLPPLDEQKRIVTKLDVLRARSRRARQALDLVPPLLENLRQSILAAAFRGDLTKDWRAKHKDVEPARKLLECIRAERRKKWEEVELAKMRAQGKVPTDDAWKAKCKDPEPVDAMELPALPQGWCWASVEEISSIVTGEAFKKSEYVESGLRLLQIANVGFNATRWEAPAFVPASYAQTFPACLLRLGDFVLALNRPIIAGQLKATVLGEADVPAMLYQRVARLRLYAPDLLPTLVDYMQTSAFRQDVQQRLQGSDQPYLNTSEAARLCVPVVPLAEALELKRRIEVAMSRYRVAARLATDASQQLDVLPRSILAKAFRGELVSQDPNDEPAANLRHAGDGWHANANAKKRSRTKSANE